MKTKEAMAGDLKKGDIFKCNKSTYKCIGPDDRSRIEAICLGINVKVYFGYNVKVEVVTDGT